jgi:photosystem II biogenesis protein Psp29
MVEMHLLTVNANFAYDPIYALGVVTSFQRFMEGYQPQSDRDSIFNALCQAIKTQPQKYRQDAESLLQAVSHLSKEELIATLTLTAPANSSNPLREVLVAISDRPTFKYSRLFAIGLFTLLDKADENLSKNQEELKGILQKITAVLPIPHEKLVKDLELYQSNLTKLGQAVAMMGELVEADRKKREQREQEKREKAASSQDP